MQLVWNNVWGLNHTFRPYFERRQPSEGEDDPEKRGLTTRGQLRYSAPFVLGKFGLDAAAGYFKTPVVQSFDAYPFLLHQAIKRRFPHAVVNVIVTAIGGESSDAGAARSWERPDGLSP